MFYKQKGDMKIWLDRILHNETLRMELKQKGRQHILDKETRCALVRFIDIMEQRYHIE